MQDLTEPLDPERAAKINTAANDFFEIGRAHGLEADEVFAALVGSIVGLAKAQGDGKDHSVDDWVALVEELMRRQWDDIEFNREEDAGC